MSQRSAAISNDPLADEAANDYLLAGGSALGAVLTGFFTSAGSHAGVLLSPLTLLVGGVGAGSRAFDGRLRQPGLGTKRPRGFVEGEAVPEAARVAVPTGVLTALVAHAHDPAQKLSSIVKAGLQAARRSGADARAELLKRIRTAGASALSEPAFLRPTLRAAGVTEGGLLTPEDFGAVTDVDLPATATLVGDRELVEAPWAREDAVVDVAAGTPDTTGIGYVTLAIDVSGTAAAIAYRRVVDGFIFEELDLEAPLAATPVQRGVPRVAPGSPLAAPAPVAFLKDDAGRVCDVIGAPLAARLDDALVADPPLRLTRDASTRQVTAHRKK